MIYLIYGLIAMVAFGIGYIFYTAYKALTVEPKCRCLARFSRTRISALRVR